MPTNNSNAGNKPGLFSDIFLNYSKLSEKDKPNKRQARELLEHVRKLHQNGAQKVGVTYSANFNQTKNIRDIYGAEGKWKINFRGSNQAQVMKEVQKLLKNEYKDLQQVFRVIPITTINIVEGKKEKTTDDIIFNDIENANNFIKSGGHLLGWKNQDTNKTEQFPYAIGGAGGVAGDFFPPTLREKVQNSLLEFKALYSAKASETQANNQQTVAASSPQAERNKPLPSTPAKAHKPLPPVPLTLAEKSRQAILTRVADALVKMTKSPTHTTKFYQRTNTHDVGIEMKASLTNIKSAENSHSLFANVAALSQKNRELTALGISGPEKIKALRRLISDDLSSSAQDLNRRTELADSLGMRSSSKEIAENEKGHVHNFLEGYITLLARKDLNDLKENKTPQQEKKYAVLSTLLNDIEKNINIAQGNDKIFPGVKEMTDALINPKKSGDSPKNVAKVDVGKQENKSTLVVSKTTAAQSPAPLIPGKAKPPAEEPPTPPKMNHS